MDVIPFGHIDVAEIKKILTMMAGTKVNVTPSDPWHPKKDEMYTVAHYLSEEGKLKMCGMIDLPIGATLAAALTRIPKDSLEDTIQNNSLDDMFLENLKEIMNMCACFLNKDNYEHVILKDIQMTPEAPSPDAKKLLAQEKQRLDFVVDIPGLHKGKLSFIS